MAKVTGPKDPLLDASHESLHWSVILSPGDVRSYRGGTVSLTPAELTAEKEGKLQIFASFEEFSKLPLEDVKRVADRTQFFATPEITTKYPLARLTELDFALLVWRHMVHISKTVDGVSGRHIGYVKSSTRGSGRAKVRGNKVYVVVQDKELAPEELKARANARLPAQARACLSIIELAGTSEVQETRLKELMDEHAAKLNTKQEPWRIFAYYRPQLIKNKFIRVK